VRAGLDVDVESRLSRLAAIGVELITEDDERYPTALVELPDRPMWLFVRGALPSRCGVAVVGSRRATRYGMDVARKIASQIGFAGWPVISGLANGIDTASHHGALDTGGETTAVLGSGIDVWYPRRNRPLGEAILASGGGVISESPPGTLPEPWRFPARNRIISGLSGVVIVVEAAVKSGALITARLALEHGRFVMAVPGDLTRETSAGANLLIRDGAHPLTEIHALVDELELVLGPAPRPSVATAEPEAEPDPLMRLLGPTSVPIDDLVARSGLPVGELLARLTSLELSGRVSVNGGFVSAV
jgi:DNA processing protein